MFKAPTSKSGIFGDSKEQPAKELFTKEQVKTGLFAYQEPSKKVISDKEAQD